MASVLTSALSVPKFYLIRYGPAPEDTEDERGEYHTSLDETVTLEMAGLPSPEDEDFIGLVVDRIWQTVMAKGFGNMLIGSCSGFVYDEQSCGNAYQDTMDGEFPDMTLRPVGYRKLFAVAKIKNKDIPGSPTEHLEETGTDLSTGSPTEHLEETGTDLSTGSPDKSSDKSVRCLAVALDCRYEGAKSEIWVYE